LDFSELRDEELMLLICRRDVQAFETLYDRYGDLVFSVAVRVVGDAALAEDAVQDVFLRLWRRPDSYTIDRGRFLTWLLSVARNRAIDERRSRGRRQKHEMYPADPPVEDRVFDEEDDPALAAVLADEREAIRGAMATLPAEQRQAIELAYFGGLTQQEISSQLGQPLGTVKTRIRLGMQKLRVALAQMNEHHQVER
jgi:RNA polymerase sigma-70 factor (ECF subfamily)